MNTYGKKNGKWQVFEYKSTKLSWNRNLKWHEWIDLRLIQLRDWIHLFGKEK